MKIAVIGAGAIGSIIAACLSKTGLDVVLVGRSDQVEAIKNKGLRISGVENEEGVKIAATKKLDKQYDLTIFAVKTQDIEDAYGENHEFLEETLVMTTQNGVQADNILSSHFEKEKMISSIVMFGATYIKPGEVTYNFPGQWIIGRPYTANDSVVFDVAEICKVAFDVTISDDIMGMKWLKLFVNFNNCIPALTGKSMQETFADIDLCKLSILLLREGFEIIKRAKIQLVSLPNFPADRIAGLTGMPLDQSSGIINKTLTTLSKEPLYGSILQSIMRKKVSEIDYINGEVHHLSRHVGMSAPLNRKVVELVHQVETSGKFLESSEIKKQFNLTYSSSQKK